MPDTTAVVEAPVGGAQPAAETLREVPPAFADLDAGISAVIAKVEGKEAPAKKEAATKDAPKPADPAKGGIPESLFGKKEASSDAPDYVEPESIKAASPKTREDFKKLSTELHETRRKVKELESRKPETVRDDAALTTLKQERDQLAAQVEKLSLYADPDFQGTYSAGIDKSATAAAERLKEAGGNEAALKRALRLNGRARDEALEEAIGDLPAYDQRRIMEHTREIERLENERDAKARNPQETLKALEQERIERSKAATERDTKLRRGVFDSVKEKLAAEYVLLRKAEGDGDDVKAHNAQVAAALQHAERMLFAEGEEVPTYEEYAKAAVVAPLAARYQSLYMQEREARIAAETRLRDVSAADVTGGSGGAEGGKADPIAGALKAGGFL